MAQLLRNIAAFVIFCALTYYATVFVDRTDTRDLSIYLDAAARVRSGEPLYNVRYTFAASGPNFELQYLYPPALAALLALPLAVLSADAVATLWQLGHAVALLLTAALLTDFLRRVKIACPNLITSPPCVAALFMALALWPPTLDGILWGQVNSYILLLLCTVLYCTATGSERIAGAALGLAVALKATPLVLAVPLLLHRRVHTLVWGALAGAAAHVPLLLYPRGVAAIPDFMHASAAISAGNVVNDPHYEYSVRRVLSLIWSPSVQWVTPIAAGVLCIYGAALLYGRWRSHAAGSSTERSAALCALETSAGIAAMLSVSPLLWFHHLIWLFPLVTILSAASASSSMAILGRLIYLTLAPLLYVHIAARNNAQINDWLFKSLPIACIIATALLIWGVIMRAYSAPNALDERREGKDASH